MPNAPEHRDATCLALQLLWVHFTLCRCFENNMVSFCLSNCKSYTLLLWIRPLDSKSVWTSFLSLPQWVLESYWSRKLPILFVWQVILITGSLWITTVLLSAAATFQLISCGVLNQAMSCCYLLLMLRLLLQRWWLWWCQPLQPFISPLDSQINNSPF